MSNRDDPARYPPFSSRELKDQQEKVVILLKKWKDLYSTSRGSAPDADAFMTVSTVGLSGGSWPLNKEILKDSAQKESLKVVVETLEWLRENMFCVYRPIKRVFLNEDVGDADYDLLIKRATQGYEGSKTLAIQAEMAIKVLTMMLMGEDLWVEYPDAGVRMTSRQRNRVDGYHRYYLSYDKACEELGKKYKRVRVRAYQKAADDEGISRRTIEEAVKYVEQQLEEDQWASVKHARETPCAPARKDRRHKKKGKVRND